MLARDKRGKEGWIIRGVTVMGEGDGCARKGFGVGGGMLSVAGVTGGGGLSGMLREGVGAGVSSSRRFGFSKSQATPCLRQLPHRG